MTRHRQREPQRETDRQSSIKAQHVEPRPTVSADTVATAHLVEGPQGALGHGTLNQQVQLLGDPQLQSYHGLMAHEIGQRQGNQHFETVLRQVQPEVGVEILNPFQEDWLGSLGPAPLAEESALAEEEVALSPEASLADELLAEAPAPLPEEPTLAEEEVALNPEAALTDEMAGEISAPLVEESIALSPTSDECLDCGDDAAPANEQMSLYNEATPVEAEGTLVDEDAALNTEVAAPLVESSAEDISPSDAVQPKLTVSQPDDATEIEANATADAVVRQPLLRLAPLPDAPPNTTPSEVEATATADAVTKGRPINRQPAEADLTEEPVLDLEGTLGSGSIARATPPPDDEDPNDDETNSEAKIQQLESGGDPPPPDDEDPNDDEANLEAKIQQLESGGDPLPPEAQAFFEAEMGVDFEAVRIHTDETAGHVTPEELTDEQTELLPPEIAAQWAQLDDDQREEVAEQYGLGQDEAPPESKSNASTDAGPRPQLNLTRTTSPLELANQRAAGDHQVSGQAAETDALIESDYGQDAIYPTEEPEALVLGEDVGLALEEPLDAAETLTDEVGETLDEAAECQNAACEEDWAEREEELEDKDEELEEKEAELQIEAAKNETQDEDLQTKEAQQLEKTFELNQARRTQQTEFKATGLEQQRTQDDLTRVQREMANAEQPDPSMQAQTAQLQAKLQQVGQQLAQLTQQGQQQQQQGAALEDKAVQLESSTAQLTQRRDEHIGKTEEHDESLEEQEENWAQLEEDMAAGCQPPAGAGPPPDPDAGQGVGDPQPAVDAILDCFTSLNVRMTQEEAVAMYAELQALHADRSLLAEQVAYDAGAIMAEAQAQNAALLGEFGALSAQIQLDAQGAVAQLITDAEATGADILAKAEKRAKLRKQKGETDAAQAIKSAEESAAKSENPAPIIAAGKEKALNIIAKMEADVKQIIATAQGDVRKLLQETAAAVGVELDTAAADQTAAADDASEAVQETGEVAAADTGDVVGDGLDAANDFDLDAPSIPDLEGCEFPAGSEIPGLLSAPEPVIPEEEAAIAPEGEVLPEEAPLPADDITYDDLPMDDPAQVEPAQEMQTQKTPDPTVGSDVPAAQAPVANPTADWAGPTVTNGVPTDLNQRRHSLYHVGTPNQPSPAAGVTTDPAAADDGVIPSHTTAQDEHSEQLERRQPYNQGVAAPQIGPMDPREAGVLPSAPTQQAGPPMPTQNAAPALAISDPTAALTEHPTAYDPTAMHQEGMQIQSTDVINPEPEAPLVEAAPETNLAPFASASEPVVITEADRDAAAALQQAMNPDNLGFDMPNSVSSWLNMTANVVAPGMGDRILESGIGIDREAVFDILENSDNPAALEAAYQELYPDRDLRTDLASEFGERPDFGRASALLDGYMGPPEGVELDVAATVITLYDATAGIFGSDKPVIFGEIQQYNPIELVALKQEYFYTYGRTLESDILDWGYSDEALPVALLREAPNTVEEAQALDEEGLADFEANREAKVMQTAIEEPTTDNLMRMMSALRDVDNITLLEAQCQEQGIDNLDEYLQANLDGLDYQRAQALLAGDTITADAIGIFQQMEGNDVDAQAIETIYELNRTEVESAAGLELTSMEVDAQILARNEAIKQAYNQLVANSDANSLTLTEAIDANLGGSQRDLIQGLATNDEAAIDAARLEQVLTSGNEEAVFNLLEAQHQRAQADAYRDVGAVLLSQGYTVEQVQNVFSDPGMTNVMQEVIAANAKLNITNLKTTFGERYPIMAIAPGYQIQSDSSGYGTMPRPQLGGDMYNPPQSGPPPVPADSVLDLALKHNLQGVEGQMAQTILDQNGYLAPEQAINFALKPTWANTSLLLEVLDGKTAAEIDDIRQRFNAQYDQDFDQAIRPRLEGFLGGFASTESFDVYQALEGHPETVEQLLAQTNEEYQYRTSGLGWFISGDSGAAYRNRFEMADHALSEGNERSATYSLEAADIQGEKYTQQIKETSELIGAAAAITVAMLPVVFSGGAAAAPILMALASAGLGVGADIATKALMQGATYESQDFAGDMAAIPADIAMTYLTMGLGDKAIDMLPLLRRLNQSGLAGETGAQFFGQAIENVAQDQVVELVRGVAKGDDMETILANNAMALPTSAVMGGLLGSLTPTLGKAIGRQVDPETGITTTHFEDGTIAKELPDEGSIVIGRPREDGGITTEVVDQDGNVTSTSNFDADGQLESKVTPHYDSEGNLTGQTETSINYGTDGEPPSFTVTDTDADGNITDAKMTVMGGETGPQTIDLPDTDTITLSDGTEQVLPSTVLSETEDGHRLILTPQGIARCSKCSLLQRAGALLGDAVTFAKNAANNTINPPNLIEQLTSEGQSPNLASLVGDAAGLATDVGTTFRHTLVGDPRTLGDILAAGSDVVEDMTIRTRPIIDADGKPQGLYSFNQTDLENFTKLNGVLPANQDAMFNQALRAFSSPPSNKFDETLFNETLTAYQAQGNTADIAQFLAEAQGLRTQIPDSVPEPGRFVAQYLQLKTDPRFEAELTHHFNALADNPAGMEQFATEVRTLHDNLRPGANPGTEVRLGPVSTTTEYGVETTDVAYRINADGQMVKVVNTTTQDHSSLPETTRTETIYNDQDGSQQVTEQIVGTDIQTRTFIDAQGNEQGPYQFTQQQLELVNDYPYATDETFNKALQAFGTDNPQHFNDFLTNTVAAYQQQMAGTPLNDILDEALDIRQQLPDGVENQAKFVAQYLQLKTDPRFSGLGIQNFTQVAAEINEQGNAADIFNAFAQNTNALYNFREQLEGNTLPQNSVEMQQPFINEDGELSFKKLEYGANTAEGVQGQVIETVTTPPPGGDYNSPDALMERTFTNADGTSQDTFTFTKEQYDEFNTYLAGKSIDAATHEAILNESLQFFKPGTKEDFRILDNAIRNYEGNTDEMFAVAETLENKLKDYLPGDSSAEFARQFLANGPAQTQQELEKLFDKAGPDILKQAVNWTTPGDGGPTDPQAFYRSLERQVALRDVLVHAGYGAAAGGAIQLLMESEGLFSMWLSGEEITDDHLQDAGAKIIFGMTFGGIGGGVGAAPFPDFLSKVIATFIVGGGGNVLQGLSTNYVTGEAPPTQEKMVEFLVWGTVVTMPGLGISDEALTKAATTFSSMAGQFTPSDWPKQWQAWQKWLEEQVEETPASQDDILGPNPTELMAEADEQPERTTS